MAGWRDTVLAALTGLVPGLGDDAAPVYNGYVEADFVYVAAAAPGRVVEIAADEGAAVTRGELLFRLDDLAQNAALRAAEARVAEARARLDNLRTGSREAEIAVLRASIDRALAERALAEKTLARSQTLLERELAPEAQVDADRAALQELEAQVAQLRAELHVAELPARDAEVEAARAAVEAARAEADRGRSDLEDRVVTAPIAGAVERVFFDAGEIASTGTPVVSILPPEDRHVLFFVPEPERAGFAVGDELALGCDGCPAGITVTVTRLASDPQFTPPIIYSREERRLALAACMLHEPRLLLLDEPTAGVDPKARRDFWDEIRRLSAQGVTVLVSTHYMDEAVQCDFIAYIAYGRKLISGPAREIPGMIGLFTWRVDGEEISELEAQLRADPRVGQVARFGQVLHVSGTDADALGAVAREHETRGTHRWQKREAGLEEAFIYLMAGASDNVAEVAA